MFTVRLHHGKNQRTQPVNASTRSLFERLCDLKIYTLLVFDFVSISAPDEATLKDEVHALQCLMQARTMPVPPASHALAPCVVLDPTFVESTLLAFPTNYRTASNSDTLNNCLAKIRELMDMSLLPFLLSVVWTTVANLMNLHKTRNKRLPQPCFAEKYRIRTLPDRSLHVLPEFKDQSVAFGLRRFCLTWNLLRVLLVRGLPLFSNESSVMVFVRPKDFTSSERHGRVELVWFWANRLFRIL